MVRILFSGLIGGFTGVRLKILRHLSMLVFLLEFAIAGLWLQLSPMCNGQEIFKEAFPGLVLENSCSYGIVSWDLP